MLTGPWGWMLTGAVVATVLLGIVLALLEMATVPRGKPSSLTWAAVGCLVVALLGIVLLYALRPS